MTEKGSLGGECRRTDCHDGPAEWFNPHTGWHYCDRCARCLNNIFREDRMELCRFVGKRTGNPTTAVPE